MPEKEPDESDAILFPSRYMKEGGNQKRAIGNESGKAAVCSRIPDRRTLPERLFLFPWTGYFVWRAADEESLWLKESGTALTLLRNKVLRDSRPANIPGFSDAILLDPMEQCVDGGVCGHRKQKRFQKREGKKCRYFRFPRFWKTPEGISSIWLLFR